MKFSTVFSVFLAALSVGVGASPIPSDEVQEKPETLHVEPIEMETRRSIDSLDDSLEKREDPPAEETQIFKQFAAVHKDMKKDQYYAFTVKWTHSDGPGNHASKKEMQEVQKKYGFDHIALVAGHVTETTKGKGNKKKTTRDFNAQMHHLIIEGNKQDTKYDRRNWVYKSDQDGKAKAEIEFVKATTDKKIKSASKKASQHNDDQDKKWKAEKNDCNSFVETMKTSL